MRCKKGKEIVKSVNPSKLGFILHYDTKLVNPMWRDTEDRAAVLISGGDHKQPHLLGIPKVESSSGEDVEVGVMQQLDKHEIPVAGCLGTCFDTTSSNSRHNRGAHFRLERRIGHAILELECRKHVNEIHVTHANKAVFGVTKAPQKSHYKKFKQDWSSLELNKDNMKLIDWEKYKDHSFLIEKARQSLDWAETHLQKKTFLRDDYKELNELIGVYLGGQVPWGFRPNRKGAMHEARFMADAIYLISMELLSYEYMMDPVLANQVHKMAVFIAIWHGPNFLQCRVASASPSNDLSYFYDILSLADMEDCDFSRIVRNVSDSIQRHTCYIKAPQVIFALFYEMASPNERQELASAVAAISRPDLSPSHFKAGKLPPVPLVCSTKECVGTSQCEMECGNSYSKKTLFGLVSAKSYVLFNLLKIDDLTWLEEPVSKWSTYTSFTRCRDFVNDLVVVNDGAERGNMSHVCSEFLNIYPLTHDLYKTLLIILFRYQADARTD